MKFTTIVIATTMAAAFAAGAAAAQQPRPATGKDQVDASKVQSVDDWAKRKGATEVWVNNPQAPRTKAQATSRVAPSATTGAESVAPTTHRAKPAKTKHAKRAKKKIRTHAAADSSTPSQ